ARVHRIAFFYHDPAATEIYPLSLHDALPISTFIEGTQQDTANDARSSPLSSAQLVRAIFEHTTGSPWEPARGRSEGRRNSFSNRDRKSTRLNSSHDQISYAVFCLKKTNKNGR